MRKYNVEVEGTRFELEVEEYKQVPLIRSINGQGTWMESARNENVHNYPGSK